VSSNTSDSVEALRAGVIASYSTPEAIERYRDRLGQGLRRWERTLLSTVMSEPGEVLVVGCGTGREAFALEELGWTVTGVDITPALVDIARAEAHTRHSSVRFHLIDGERFPVSSGSMHAVTLWAQVLNNVPTHSGRVNLMREACRVLAPGSAATFSVHDRALTLTEVDPDRIVSTDEPEAGDLFVLDPDTGIAGLNHYFDEGEVRRLCAEAGFDVLDLAHTSDLGESWGNVFVGTALKSR